MRNRRWHHNNRMAKAAKWDQLKEAVMNVYTNGEQSCRHCGQCDLDVLCLDHINNDGKAHRTKVKQDSIYGWVVRNDYPVGFQVLCFNCNMKKEITRRREALCL